MAEPDFSRIRAFAFDVDGVFTDGSIQCTTDGDLLRTYDAKDGFSVRMAVMNGYTIGIITGGSSESIRKRMTACGVVKNVYLHSRNKIEDFNDFLAKNGLAADEVLYMGDDIPDIEVASMAGIGACPADSVEEMKAASDYVCSHNGGHGAIREVIEKTLKLQGRWIFDTAEYKKEF